MAKPRLTSLTETRLHKFMNDSVTNSGKTTIFCENIHGFYAKKLKNDLAFRLRYRDDADNIKTYTIGKLSSFKPEIAAQRANEILVELEKGSDPLKDKRERKALAKENERLGKQRTLGNYLDGRYTQVQNKKRSGKETLNMIRYNFSDWLEREMTAITPADIKEWQIKREQSIKFDTIQRAYGALKTMLNKAVEDGFIENNPLPRKSPLEKPHYSEVDQKIDIGKEQRRALSTSEINALFTALDSFSKDLRQKRRNSIARGRKYLESLDNVIYPHWIVPFTITAYYTGLRTGDILALRWENLNLNFQKITITPTKTRHHADPIKVNLDLPDSYIEKMKLWHVQEGKPKSGLVFPSPVTGEQMDKKAHLKSWKHIKELAGLQDDLAFYSFRHNFISQLVMNNVPMLTVAKMAGHKSVKMIEQNYGHLLPDHTKGLLNIFNPTALSNAVKHG